MKSDKSIALHVLENPIALRNHLLAQGLQSNPDEINLAILPELFSVTLRCPPSKLRVRRKHKLFARSNDPARYPFLAIAQIIAGRANDEIVLSLTGYSSEQGDEQQKKAMGSYLIAGLQGLLDRAGAALPSELTDGLIFGKDVCVEIGNTPALVCELILPEPEPDQNFDVIMLQCRRVLQTGEWDAWLSDPAILAVLASEQKRVSDSILKRCRELLRQHDHPLAEVPIELFTTPSAQTEKDEKTLVVLSAEGGFKLYVYLYSNGNTELSIISPHGEQSSLP